MEQKEEGCCTIDYEHHKAIFEKRRRAFLKDPDKRSFIVFAHTTRHPCCSG